MKLSELKKIAKECGYVFEKEFEKYSLKKENKKFVISNEYINTLWTKNELHCDKTDFKMIEKCVEFAKTPLHERIDILDDIERDYLHTIINPWRNKVEHIRKERLHYNTNFEYITILIRLNNGINISLPYFKKGKMYKNMKLNKKYNLEELGV